MTVIDRFAEVFGDGHFVLCRGKRRLNDRLFTAAEAKAHAETGGQVGLWIPDGFIAIDIDDRQQADILDAMTGTFRCRTRHGEHFYFISQTVAEERQRVKAHTPIGLVVDTRVANKGYCIIPVNDDSRQMIDGVIEPLPMWLEPLNIHSNAPRFIVPGAQEGDGRNDSMLKQVMRLKSFFRDDDIRTIVGIINTHVFSQPMPEEEIENILRSAAKYSPTVRENNEFLLYNDRGTPIDVNHEAIVRYMISHYRMFVLGEDDLYIYQGGVFVNNGKAVRDIIKSLIENPRWQKQAIIMAVYRMLVDCKELIIDETMCNYDKRKINFLNGMFDIDSQQLLPHSPDYLSTIQIPFNYIANDLRIDDVQLFDFLHRAGMRNDDMIMLLKYLAYCMLPANNLKCFLVLVGQSNTGKSTIINIISKLLGAQNVSNLSIHHLSERFYPSELKDKLLNANADDESMALTSIATLKKITGNDRIMWERKGQTPYFFTPTSRLLFSFNKLPQQVEERSDAFWQRIRILEMDHKVIITQSYYDDLVSDESIMAIIPILCRAAKNIGGSIEHSARSYQLTQKLRNESDSLTAFSSTMLELTGQHSDFVTKEALLLAYNVFVTQRDYHAYTKKELWEHLEGMGLKEVRRGEGRQYGYYGVRLLAEPKEN